MIRFNRSIALILGTLLVFSSVLDAKDRSAKGVKLHYKSLNAKAMKEYSIDYCAASFDELYGVLKHWADISG